MYKSADAHEMKVMTWNHDEYGWYVDPITCRRHYEYGGMLNQLHVPVGDIMRWYNVGVDSGGTDVYCVWFYAIVIPDFQICYNIPRYWNCNVYVVRLADRTAVLDFITMHSSHALKVML